MKDKNLSEEDLKKLYEEIKNKDKEEKKKVTQKDSNQRHRDMRRDR